MAESAPSLASRRGEVDAVPPSDRNRSVAGGSRWRRVATDACTMQMRVDDARGSDTARARLEDGLPPLWEPAQGIRSRRREATVLDATPAGADTAPICEGTILDSPWSWPT